MLLRGDAAIVCPVGSGGFGDASGEGRPVNSLYLGFVHTVGTLNVVDGGG
jgi:hypothetical protein